MSINESDNPIEEWLNSFSQTIEETGFYINEDGEFCKSENQEWIPLSNFVLRPVEIIMKVSESGIAEDYKYVFDGILHNEKMLKKIEVLESDLVNPKWIQRLDVFCEIYGSRKQNYGLLLKYIFLIKKGIPKRIEYNTIGWHRFEGKWFFLHSGGAIGETQNNIVSTSNTQFLFNKNDALSEKESFLESLIMLDIFDRKLSYSLLSFLLTSIITTPLLHYKEKELTPNYLVWIAGRSGYGKTRFSKFITNIYKKGNVARPDDNKISVIIPGVKEHKDCVYVIDDYGTSKTKQTEYSVIEKVESIIRNLSDRNYSSSNLSDGMVLIVGEKFLPADEKYESSKKRIIRLKMENLFNRNDQSTYGTQKSEEFDLLKNKLSIPSSITYYIEWLSEKLNLTFLDDYKRDFDALKKQLGEKYNAHGRHADSFAHQISAYHFYMKYGWERGFLTADDYFRKNDDAKKIFEELLEDQSIPILDNNVELFLDALKELILDEKIIVRVDNYSDLHFEQKIYGLVRIEKEQEVLKLAWESVYLLVTKHLGNKNTKIVGPKILAKLLDADSLLCFNERSTTKPFKARRKNENDRCRVIHFITDKIPDVMGIIMRKALEDKAKFSSIPKELLK